LVEFLALNPAANYITGQVRLNPNSHHIPAFIHHRTNHLLFGHFTQVLTIDGGMVM
jgi:hypothetical protein